ncbi:FAD dependent oxidoreductase [Diplogelasinospora grovesii]|uniref:FAD dependent oxidoreductase n=1 Tax=Diplogelasinospora grovesii TaxID=303347 RepID=A0AAN6NHW9_9PEZI|nr:FAD dependent oxidoreductase [Diplogelasinospora grovesii]
MPHIIVIGAGVIGLSCGLELQNAGYDVTIVARDLPAPFEVIDSQAQINFSSPWAGAHNRFIPPNPQADPDGGEEHAMALATFARMDALAQAHPGEAGVTFMKGIEYLEAPVPEHYLSLTEDRAAELGYRDFRLLPAEQLPSDGKGVAWGCEYRTWCLNPMMYCCFLLRRFVIRGGKLHKREVRSAQEMFHHRQPELGAVDAVVNATGTGFGDDDKMFITRGQTCVVAEPCDATVTRQNADGSWTFCVPRGFDGGTVIGGTREPDNWSATPSAELRETLLQKLAVTYPPILGESGKLTPIRDIVGRRPTRRGGPRIEGEMSASGFVMHVYGFGGRGYELSWGAAERALEGVQSHLGEKAKL